MLKKRRHLVPLALIAVLLALSPAFVKSFASESDGMVVDMDTIPLGPLNDYEFPGGRITAPNGHAMVMIPMRSNTEKGLRIFGGRDRSVHVAFLKPVRAESIRLSVERWTSRGTCELKLDVKIGDHWREGLLPDKQLTTGSPANVRISLDQRPGASDAPGQEGEVRELRLRFSSTGGALLWYLSLEPHGNAAVAGPDAGSLKRIVTPVLIDGGGTPVDRIRFFVPQDKKPVIVKEVEVRLDKLESLRSASVLVGGHAYPVLPFTPGIFRVRIDRELQPGRQEIELLLEADDKAAYGATVRGGITALTFDDRSIVFKDDIPDRPIARLLLAPGLGDVHTYRIPGLVRTNKGTLLAVYDFRYHSASDLPADIDVGLSRSIDGGDTWEAPRVALDFSGHDPQEGVGDPSILVDRLTGRIWIAAVWAHAGRSIGNSEPGLKLGTSAQFVLSFSDDDGITWSRPRNITPEIGAPNGWRIVFNGPGNGICTKKGVLVFPAQFWDENKIPHSTLLVSEDRGKTWRIGTGALPQTTEAQVVETSDGALLLNMRSNIGKARAVAVTRDLGKTWTEHPTSRNVLVEPVCQASIIQLDEGEAVSGRRLAFFNPSNPYARIDSTLRISEDGGESWPRALLLHEPASYGYSDMCLLDRETIALLYETRGGLIFQKVRLDDVPKTE